MNITSTMIWRGSIRILQYQGAEIAGTGFLGLILVKTLDKPL